jgi:hypothetical protein
MSQLLRVFASFLFFWLVSAAGLVQAQTKSGAPTAIVYEQPG